MRFIPNKVLKLRSVGGPVFQHHDKHQVGINYYKAFCTSQNKSAIIDNQSHDLTNDKDIIITDIIKINNNNFRDVRIFNNLGTNYYHTLDNNDPRFTHGPRHVVELQINKPNHHYSTLHNGVITHGNISPHTINNNTRRHRTIVARTDPDIVPNTRLYRNVSSLPYKPDVYTVDLLLIRL